MSGVRVEVVSDVLGGIVDRLNDLSQVVTIGVHEDAEDYPDGTPVAVVAGAQEFGTDTIPARPFLRGYFDSGGAKEMGDVAAETVGDVVDGAPPDSVGEAVGLVAEEGIRDRIESDIPPPLSDTTLSKPDRDPRGIALMDTETLWDSISHEVMKI